MQNGCAGVPESGAGNGRSIRSGKGKHRRGSQPGHSFSDHGDPYHDVVPKWSRSGASGGGDAGTADSEIYRTGTAKIERDKLRLSLLEQPADTQLLVFAKRVIGVAVQPTLAWLSRRDHRMPARVRVFGRMMVWRAIAAECRAARLTGPQMHPLRADLYAFFAFAALRLFDRIDRVKMRATSIGHDVILAAPDERKQLRSILRRQRRRLA
jgi:hypothetical protein